MMFLLKDPLCPTASELRVFMSVFGMVAFRYLEVKVL